MRILFALLLMLTLGQLSTRALAAAGPISEGAPKDFSFVNTDIRTAFKTLASIGKVDIVVAPNVAGMNVNVELTDKSWQEAMKVLCQMFNLHYRTEQNYLYVENMTDFNKQMVENATAAQQAGAVAPLKREIVTIKNAKAKDLSNSIRDLLSPRGKLNVVDRNNALIILDTEANIREIKNSISKLDIPTKQVNIRAKLVQVNSDALRQMGVDWQLGTSGNVNPLISNPGKLPTTSQPGAVATSSPGGSISNAASAAGTGAAVGGVAGATSQVAFGLLNGNLAMAIAYMINDGQGEVLAQPQITTLDNMEAEIFLGEEVPQRVLDARGTPGIVNQEAGTALKVTPHVTGDGRVLLDLAPEKSSFRANPSGGQFIVDRQKAKTSVLVNNGETVVIAGLTSKEESSVETGIPFLKDIPLLGYLFKYKSSQMRKRDLIIFVTPNIVESPKDKAALAEAERSLLEQENSTTPEPKSSNSDIPQASYGTGGGYTAPSPSPSPSSEPGPPPIDNGGGGNEAPAPEDDW